LDLADMKKGYIMKEARFEMQWPGENLAVNCYTHQVTNYHYHWHPEEYELNILLHGSQDFCRGTESRVLCEDDVLLVGPGVGHASFAQSANTRALVLHFPARVFREYLKKGYVFDFPDCCSSWADRDDARYRLIRFYGAQIFEALSQEDEYAGLKAKGSLELLLSVLCGEFHPVEARMLPEPRDQVQKETMIGLIEYVESHYSEKLTLEELAGIFQYNRTYVSTLFKQMVGINFYEYLTRVRFQHALSDLVETERNLAEIAMEHGFADLKSFHKRFKETFHRTPAGYRSQVTSRYVPKGERERIYVEPTDALVQEKMREYVRGPFCKNDKK